MNPSRLNLFTPITQTETVPIFTPQNTVYQQVILGLDDKKPNCDSVLYYVVIDDPTCTHSSEYPHSEPDKFHMYKYTLQLNKQADESHHTIFSKYIATKLIKLGVDLTLTIKGSTYLYFTNSGGQEICYIIFDARGQWSKMVHDYVVSTEHNNWYRDEQLELKLTLPVVPCSECQCEKEKKLF